MYGAFNISFVFNNVTNIAKQQIIGITTNAAPTPPPITLSHGINNHSTFRSYYINGKDVAGSPQPFPIAGGTDTTYTITFDGTTFRHYINGVIYSGKMDATPPAPGEYKSTVKGPYYIYAYIDPSAMTSMRINYEPNAIAVTGPTGPLRPGIMSYSIVTPNTVSVDEITGRFKLSGSTGVLILSSTPVNGPFVLTFSFSGITLTGGHATLGNNPSNGRASFGMHNSMTPTTPGIFPSFSVFSGGTAMTSTAATSYGLTNPSSTAYGGGYLVNNTQYTCGTTAGVPAAPVFLTTGATSTCSINYNGTNYEYYVNNILVFKGPHQSTDNLSKYVCVSIHPAAVYSANAWLSIEYTPSLIGPTGIIGWTGPTGPRQTDFDYIYSPTVTVDPSTGDFFIDKYGGIVSANPVTNGPFRLTVTFWNVTSLTTFQTIGLNVLIPIERYSKTTSPVAPAYDTSPSLAPKHGLFNTSNGFTHWVNRGETLGALSENISNGDSRVWKVDAGPQTYEIIYDGTFMKHYMNGNLLKNVKNTVAARLYIAVSFGNPSQTTANISGRVSIKYVPAFYPTTGPIGPSTIVTVYSFLMKSGNTNPINALQSPSGYGGTSLTFATIPAVPTGIGSLTDTSAYQLVLNTTPSSLADPLITLVSPNKITNNNPSTINVRISIAAAPDSAAFVPTGTYPNMGILIYIITYDDNTVLSISQPQQISGFTYDVTLKPSTYFVMRVSGSSGYTVPANVKFIVSFTQTLVASGGAPTKRPRIVDVAPILKDKNRKSSIRVKKVKKQSAKAKR